MDEKHQDSIIYVIDEIEQVFLAVDRLSRHTSELIFSYIPENGDIDRDIYAQWKASIQVGAVGKVVAYAYTFSAAARRLLMRLRHSYAYRELEIDHLLLGDKYPYNLFASSSVEQSTTENYTLDISISDAFMNTIQELEQLARFGDKDQYLLVKLRLRFTPNIGGGGIPQREENAYWSADNTIGIDYGRTISEAAHRLLDRVLHPEAYPIPKED